MNDSSDYSNLEIVNIGTHMSQQLIFLEMRDTQVMHHSRTLIYFILKTSRLESGYLVIWLYTSREARRRLPG